MNEEENLAGEGGAAPADCLDGFEPGILGSGAEARQHFALLKLASGSELPVLIEGETGTGKEICSRWLHHNGSRRQGFFIPISCARVPTWSWAEGEVAESLIFHDVSRNRVPLEQLVTTGGTLLLDEISLLSTSNQGELLRLLQEFELVSRTSDVRIGVIATTNQDVDELLRANTLRLDLFHRLAGVRVRIPPLRDRPKDLEFLAQRFLDEVARKSGGPLCRLSPTAWQQIRAYDWPGNLRELKYLIERAALLTPDSLIRNMDLPLPEGGTASKQVTAGSIHPLARELELREREYLESVLSLCGGNLKRAAEMAELPYSTLRHKLRIHGIERKLFRGAPEHRRRRDFDH